MRGWSGTSLRNKFLTVSNKFKEYIMKTIIIAAGFMLALSTAACAKEEPKKEVSATAVVKKDAAPAAVPAAAPAPETKRICVDIQGKDGKPVIDPKTKKPRQDCKQVKIRQKHEGTKIEDAKKDTGKK